MNQFVAFWIKRPNLWYFRDWGTTHKFSMGTPVMWSAVGTQHPGVKIPGCGSDHPVITSQFLLCLLYLVTESHWQFLQSSLWLPALAYSKNEATTVYRCLFFSLATLSQTSENRHPWNFPTRRGLVFNRTFAILISFKYPPPSKTNGGQKTKFAPFFLPSCRQSAS